MTGGLFLLENVLIYSTISGLLESREYGVIIFIRIISPAFALSWSGRGELQGGEGSSLRKEELNWEAD